MKAHGTPHGALPWLPVIRWVSLLRGVLALGLGLLLLEAPDESMDKLVALLAIYLLADGGLTLLEGAQRIVHSGRPFSPYLFEGLVSIVAGGVALLRSEWLGFVLLLMGLRFVATGLAEIAAGRLLRRETGEPLWCTWLAGAASLLVGVLLFIAPSLNSKATWLLLGAYAVVFGAALLGMSGQAGHAGSLSPTGRASRGPNA